MTTGDKSAKGTEAAAMATQGASQACGAVAYLPEYGGVIKSYALSSTGEVVSIAPLKGLRHVMREAGVRPFDVLVASSSYDYAMSGFVELLSDPDALLLSFADVLDPGEDSFTAQLAEEVADHLQAHPFARRHLFSCDAGSSRSAALAAAYLRSQEVDDTCIWLNPRLSPNPFVYRLQLAAFGIDISRDEADALRAMNDEALAKQIRSSSLASTLSRRASLPAKPRTAPSNTCPTAWRRRA